MPGRGPVTFHDPADYAAGFLDDARVDFAITGPGPFKARLARLSLGKLDLFFCRERLPRIACISLRPDKTFLSLAVGAGSLVFNGVPLREGDIVLHGRGEHLYQRSMRSCRWALLSLPHEQFADCRGASTAPSSAPIAGKILRPPRADESRFRVLLRQAHQLADLKQCAIAPPDTAEILERDLLLAISRCLAGNEAEEHPGTGHHHTATMLRFEEALQAYTGETPSMPALCAKVGVAERTLRMCCARFLGVSPMRYILLRRLNRARATLMHAQASKTRVADVARDNQFVEPGRFAVTYRTIFGESPSVTLRRTP